MLKGEISLTVHAPHLDLSVVCPRDNERQSGMESSPVDTPVVPIQDILHNRITPSKEVVVHLLHSSHRVSSQQCRNQDRKPSGSLLADDLTQHIWDSKKSEKARPESSCSAYTYFNLDFQ